MKRASPLMVGIVFAGLLVFACDDGLVTRSTEAESTGSTASAEPTTAARPDNCESPGGESWSSDASTSLELIGEEGELSIYAAEYPLSGPTEGLWSQWGQGIALGDGRHLSAIGDHVGVDGNSWFYLYEDGSRSLTRIFDVLSVVPHEEGAGGYGKIHAQMVTDECGSIWAATYWGTRTDLAYGNGYDGDRLLEIDPIAGTVLDRGVIATGRGIPTMAISADGHTLVAAAVEPESDTAVVASYDTRTHSVLDELDDPRQIGYRALAAGENGDVLFSIGDGRLSAFDPASQTGSDVDAEMPGDWLRAVTEVGPDGSSYGVTQDRPELFSLAENGSAGHLGDPLGYTTSLAMSDDADQIFWMPNAHGSAWESGAVVLALDTATGKISELVKLAPIFESELGLRAGGTYSVVYDNGRLILGVNASPRDDDSGFGTVVLVVIEGL